MLMQCSLFSHCCSVALLITPFCRTLNCQFHCHLQRAAAGHPHVIQLHEVFVTQHHVALVMEYANGGDLAQHIEHCMITEVRRLSLLAL